MLKFTQAITLQTIPVNVHICSIQAYMNSSDSLAVYNQTD